MLPHAGRLLDGCLFLQVSHTVRRWRLLAPCIGAMLFLRARHFAPTERAMQWPDALGLGLFTATGTQVALGAEMLAIVAVLMGMVTAVFGGVLRDIVCNEIPRAFRDQQPYAICAFTGAWVVVGGAGARRTAVACPVGRGGDGHIAAGAGDPTELDAAGLAPGAPDEI